MDIHFRYIEWDYDEADDLECILPDELIVEVEVPEDIDINDEAELSDFLSDWLTNTYGFCHNGFEFNTL